LVLFFSFSPLFMLTEAFTSPALSSAPDLIGILSRPLQLAESLVARCRQVVRSCLALEPHDREDTPSDQNDRDVQDIVGTLK
jgi:hypothetical protein